MCQAQNRHSLYHVKFRIYGNTKESTHHTDNCETASKANVKREMDPVRSVHDREMDPVRSVHDREMRPSERYP